VDNNIKHYRYGYDALNRIVSATDNTGNYTISGIAYDKMGNIETLMRQGAVVAQPVLGTPGHFGAMDILDYDYDSGNKLLKVSDTGNSTYGFKDGANQTTEYTYDGNGNMISDANKGITSISYNHLNLPVQIDFGGGNTLEYVYDATGGKLKKTVTDVANGITETQYAGKFIYKNNDLEFFHHSEGYVEPIANGNFSYIYQYKDHLGNVRLSYTDTDGNGLIDIGEIKEENNYYPFGLQHKGYNNNINGPENNYFTYQGKEHQKELDLNWHDFGARQYDASIGRWLTQDPLAEEFYQWSSYNAMMDNPIKYIDPDGKAPFDWFKNQEGRVVWFDNTNESFTSENGDQWENVGANLEEVEESLNVPEDRNVEWKDLEFVTLGGSRGNGKGAFGATVLESAAQVSFGLNVENTGDSGLERIDSETEITGVNINITMSTETAAPGIQLTGIGGSFGIKEWTSLGQTNINDSGSFEYTPMLSKYNSYASGKASLTLGLSSFKRISRNLGEGGSFDIGINSTAAFGLQQNGKKRFFSTSNTITIK